MLTATDERAEKFLKTLDDRLHYQIKGEYCRKTVWSDHYHDRKMLTVETERMLATVESEGLVLSPVNTAMGFAVGFMVVNPSTKKPVLMFTEQQLPKGYDFRRLSRSFMSERNINLAQACGLPEIINDRDHYDY